MELLNNIDFMYLLKVCIINIFTIYVNIKILGIKNIDKKRIILLISGALFINFIYVFVEVFFNAISSIICTSILIAAICCIVFKIRLGCMILVTISSLTINYIIYLIAVVLCFIIYKCLNINDYITIFLIAILDFLIIKIIFNTRRLKKGVVFFKKYENNEYFDILVLNISSILFLAFILLTNFDENLERALLIFIVIFSMLMFITIQKSLQMYYKQRMLVKDLEETKEELEEKKKEIEALEKENMEFSKVSHSISHKQKSLEYKLNQLSMNNEIAEEIDIKTRIDKLGKSLRKESITILDKTGISEIDDMLNYMQSECVKNNIDFQVQLSGNIYTMINHYIEKEELEILLADHIKNAIIAIGYVDGVNKSILVRLGKLDGNYGLYVYDSGIEFEIETLLNLGKKPSTTHKDSGGTGMGFMNTFDTLRKHKASFIIEEYGKPVKDNFTKALKFKFDKKEEFKICSYRDEEIKNVDKENTLKVEKLNF